MPTEHDDHDKKREWLSDSIKVAVLIWSAGLLTASYVRLPGGQKVMDFDPTFIASVFSGSLAGFGITAASKAAANGNNSGASSTDVPIYSKPKEEEEKKEPEVQPIWTEPTPEPPAAEETSLEQRVEALEAKSDAEEPAAEEGFVPPRRGDL